MHPLCLEDFILAGQKEDCPLQILIKVSYYCVLAEITLAQHCNFRVHSQNPITLPAKTQLIRCVLASAALRDSFALNFSILTGVWERTLRDYFIKTLTCPNTCELERSYFHLSSLKWIPSVLRNEPTNNRIQWTCLKYYIVFCVNTLERRCFHAPQPLSFGTDPWVLCMPKESELASFTSPRDSLLLQHSSPREPRVCHKSDKYLSNVCIVVFTEHEMF